MEDNKMVMAQKIRGLKKRLEDTERERNELIETKVNQTKYNCY